MRALVAGCGYVGTALAVRLAAAGHEVFGLRRRPAGLPGGIVPLAADLCDPASLSALPGGLDVVFYTAAADGRDEAGYRAAYPEGLGNLLDALARAPRPPRRVLFTSSTSVHAQDDGAWVDESSPAEPTHFTGRTVLAAEALLAASPLPGTALRLGGIYGPGRTRLLEQVRAGRAVVPEGPPLYTNRIHRDDAAGALDHLANLPAADPVYLGVDCDPAPLEEVLGWLAGQMGAPPLPRGEGATPSGRRRRTRKRCRNDRLRATGYRFRFPTFREGYGALLAEGGA